MSDIDKVDFNNQVTSEEESDSVTVRKNKANGTAHSLLVMASAVQLGVDIVRELLDTGSLEDQVRDEEVNMVGVSSLLASTINRELRNKVIQEHVK